MTLSGQCNGCGEPGATFVGANGPGNSWLCADCYKWVEIHQRFNWGTGAPQRLVFGLLDRKCTACGELLEGIRDVGDYHYECVPRGVFVDSLKDKSWVEKSMELSTFDQFRRELNIDP